MTEYYRHNIMDESGYQRAVPVPISLSETLTLRDQFAMAAITGFLSPDKNAQKVRAEYAYSIADAMLEARKEKK